MTAAHPVAILTGASGGIVPGIADALAGAGCALVLTARGLDRLQTAAAALAAAHAVPVTAIASDACDSGSIQAMVRQVLDRFGRIDVLVNAAASSTPIGGPIEGIDVSLLIEAMDVKVGGYLRYAQAVVPAMKAVGRGHIVNIGGLTGRSSDTLSGLRNAAVSHLTKVLSDQLAPAGISVNTVNPGIVRTPHLAELFHEMAEARGLAAADIEREFLADIPARTILEPTDIGRMVAFLALAKGPTVTGESLTVDGGYSRGVYL